MDAIVILNSLKILIVSLNFSFFWFISSNLLFLVFLFSPFILEVYLQHLIIHYTADWELFVCCMGKFLIDSELHTSEDVSLEYS